MTSPRQTHGHEPPAGPPWDLPLDETPLAFLDLEMTGLDVRKDRVIELCVERVVGEKLVDRLETLVSPGAGKVGNVHVHGIDEAALAGAPSFGAIAPRLLELLSGAVIVAHAAPWDVAFLEAEFERAGQPQTLPFYLDTLTLSRRVFALQSHSLDALARELRIERTRAHRAGEDVRVLRRIFEEVVRQLQPKTPRDLWFVRIGERVARPEIVAACVSAAENDRPVFLRFRPSRKPPVVLEAHITEVRTDLDPPRVVGYALPGRGRFELRADRILSVSTSALPQAPSSLREPESKPR